MVVVVFTSLPTILGFGFRLCPGIEEKMLRVSERGGEFEGVEEKRQRRDGEFEAETGKSGGKKLPGHVQVLECEGKTSPVTREINSSPITMTVNHTVILGFLPIMRFLNLLFFLNF